VDVGGRRLRRAGRRVRRRLRPVVRELAGRPPQERTLLGLEAAALLGSVAVLVGRGRLRRAPWAVADAGLLLAGSVARTAVEALATTRPLPQAFGLPGVRDGLPERSFSANHWSAVAAAGTVGLAVLTARDARWNSLAGLGLGVAASWTVVARNAVRGELHRRRLHRALADYRPEIAVAYAGKTGGPVHVRMWEPYLLQSGLRLVVLTLDAKYLDAIRQGVTVPLVQLGALSRQAVEPLIVPSLRTFFYVQNAGRNATYLSFDRITHVWLGHGESDKPGSASANHDRYDRLLVSGRASVDRYAEHGVHIDPAKLLVVGRPQVSAIRVTDVPISEVESPVVLYAPTWQGRDPEADFSSLPIGPRIVEALVRRGVTVIFRPHPVSAGWSKPRQAIARIHEILRADHEATGRPHVFGDVAEKEWTLVDCANHADALISDVSGVVSDFLQSEKPYAMVSMQADVETFRAKFPMARSGYVLTSDLADLQEVLDDLLGRDPLAESRRAAKRYVLGDASGDPAAAFARTVRELAQQPASPREVAL
jgi:CDP-glycerol:poly(glycerophosphate) glycerophosphotransferase